MKPEQSLLDALIEQSLLPDDADTNAAIENFATLEESIVRHVAALDPTPQHVVWDDAERISDPQIYCVVADDFFEAMPKAPSDVPLDCSYDESTETITFSIDFKGKQHSASWVQQLDWISSEFLDLIVKATSSRAGRFVELSPGDQSFMFVYLASSLAKQLDAYRASDADSRESVFTSQSIDTRHRFKDLVILSRREYRGALARLKHQLMTGDNPADPADFKDGSAIRVATASKYDSALELFTRARRSNTRQYAMLEHWHHEAICPDEACYVLLVDDPDREIIFQIDADLAGLTMGDQEKDFGSFLLVALDGSWSIFAHDDFLTCSGEKVLSLLQPLLQSVPPNANAEQFAQMREGTCYPLLESLGYDQRKPGLAIYIARDYANHIALININGRQESPEDPVEMSLSLRQYCPTIDGLLYEDSGTLETSVWKAQRKPPGGESTKWTIDAEADVAAITNDITALIRDAAAWLEQPESMEDWQNFLEDEGYFLGAAAAAVAREDRSNAQRLADLTLAEADNKDKYTAGEDVKKLKAMGLKVK